MMNGKEHDIIKAIHSNFESEAEKKRKANEPIPVYGLMMELFEFKTNINDNTSHTAKEGRIFRPTTSGQVEFIKGLQNKSGHIQLKDKKRKATDAKFWTKERAEIADIKQMVEDGFMLKHNSVLRLLFCADQVSKVVVSSENFDCTLQDWLTTATAQSLIPDGDYLSDQGKKIIRSGWTAIEHVWSRGYTCVHLDLPSTYVMVGTDLKILPFFIRKRFPSEKDDSGKFVLRANFAALLEKIFVDPLWHDSELGELTELMRNKDAEFELILGHPVLVSPEERQVMYRTAYYPYMTKDQISALKTNISMNSDWIKNAKALDLAFNDILQGSFSNDAIGALQFAVIASCHYGQRLKSAYPIWNGQLAPDYVDRQLKQALQLLLCKRYALKIHDAFKSKTQFQL